MNVVMLTNTYLPHVGGVAYSIDRFTRIYRDEGHRVLIVAPEYEGDAPDEDQVVRVKAIQHFNGSDFAVALPAPAGLRSRLETFKPDILHAHHPFLLGDTALRLAAAEQLPLVFTHHTMYEQYTHYVPLEADRLGEVAIALATNYANMCDHVFAPSDSVRAIIRRRGVTTPISVVPTGVDVDQFARGDGHAFRKRLGIPDDAFVVGHVGRLAPEKNLEFLANAVRLFLHANPKAVFLVIGSGPSADQIKMDFVQDEMDHRLYLAGKQTGQDLVDGYHAMDLFAFASKSETQGMVLIEAMAAGNPVVAIDAPGAREVVSSNLNGKLIPIESAHAFATALDEIAQHLAQEPDTLPNAARDTAQRYSTQKCAQKALRLYDQIIRGYKLETEFDHSAWAALLRTVQEEWTLWSDRMAMAKSVILDEPLDTTQEKQPKS